MMLAFEDRYTRQRCLPEVGASGQRLLGRASVLLPADTASNVARSYLERAGVGRVSLSAGMGGDEFAHGRAFRHQGARGVALGAWRALNQIRNLLGLAERSDEEPA